MDDAALDKAVAAQINRRLASADQLRQTPSGLVCIATQLALDVSSTTIREAIAGYGRSGVSGERADLLPVPVLDYIQQHHLYQTH
jgi:nicotinate-nucleotide adenylyltransferase